MIRVRHTDLELQGMGDEIRDELIPRAEAALADGVNLIVEAAHANLRRRKGTARTASPAGEPPEFDSGTLLRSVQAGKVRRTKNSVRQEYGSTHPAAGLHEFGGTVARNGVRRRYLPRPYLRPAEDTTRAAVEARLEKL